MKKKIISILLIMLILIFVATLNYAKYTEMLEENIQIVETNKEEYSKNETIELIVNTQNNPYTNSTVIIKSDNIDIENFQTNETEDIIDENIEKENGQITINLTKEQTLNKIVLYYSIPENIEINETITFEVTVQNKENDEEEQMITKQVKIIEDEQDDKPNTEKGEENFETDTKVEAELNGENLNNQESLKNNSQFNAQSQNNMQVEQVSNRQSNSQSTTQVSMSAQDTSRSTNQQTVTYNGSSNNYLSNLEIENYELNEDFSKENSTYFVNIENDVEELEITAEAEDSNAYISVYGNENLKTGTNKVLIFVTAEDGSVRTYRIYVTKNS